MCPFYRCTNWGERGCNLQEVMQTAGGGARIEAREFPLGDQMARSQLSWMPNLLPLTLQSDTWSYWLEEPWAGVKQWGKSSEIFTRNSLHLETGRDLRQEERLRSPCSFRAGVWWNRVIDHFLRTIHTETLVYNETCPMFWWNLMFELNKKYVYAIGNILLLRKENFF